MRSLRLSILARLLAFSSFFLLASNTLAQEATAPKPNAKAGQNAPAPDPWANDAEVRALVEKSVAAIKEKKFVAAIPSLTKAAKKYPQDSKLRHLLGFALFHNKQAGPAWLQFRAAVRLNLAYPPGVRDFLSMWQVFDQQGVVNAGRSMEYVTKALGNPDKKSGNERVQVWEYGFMRLQFNDDKLFAVIDPRGLDPKRAQPVDSLQVQFDDKSRWRLGYRMINQIHSRSDYAPQDESVQHWKELLSVMRLYPATQKSPQAVMAGVEANLRKMNPEIDFKALLDQEGEVIFHWRDKGDKSKNRPPQHEIVRLVTGEKDIHRIAYSRRVGQIPAEEAKAWVTLLRNAELVKTVMPRVNTAAKEIPTN